MNIGISNWNNRMFELT